MLSGVGVACSGNSAPNSPGAIDAGMTLYSCTIPSAAYCEQRLIAPADRDQLSQTCGLSAGVVGTGCSPIGVVGCCLPLANDRSKDEACWYGAEQFSMGMPVCTGGQWSTTP
jgi:hypothetical protein